MSAQMIQPRSLRPIAWVLIVLGMICGGVVALPSLARAQSSPFLSVATEQIDGPNGTVALDVILGPGAEPITALTFILNYDPSAVTATGLDVVTPAGGTFNSSVPGSIKVGVFYTSNPFDPNDQGGFASQTVIARLILTGQNLTTNSIVGVELVEAFDINDDGVALVQVSGAITVAGADERGALSGYVWEDFDNDGLQDFGAGRITSGVEGVAVEVTGPSFAATAVTNAVGVYRLDNLVPGIYNVMFTTPEGRSWTIAEAGDDTNDSDANVSGEAGSHVVVAGQINDTVDAGLVSLAPEPSTPVTPDRPDVAPDPFPPLPSSPAPASPNFPVRVETNSDQAVQLAYPGPFKVDTSGAEGLPGGFGLNPAPSTTEVLAKVVTDQAGSDVAASNPVDTAADTAPRPLANTGAQTNLLSTLAIGLFALGGTLLVSARRRTM